MLERTKQELVTFSHPFSLAGVDGQQDPGTYMVELIEEPIDGLSFVAYRRVDDDHPAVLAIRLWHAILRLRGTHWGPVRYSISVLMREKKMRGTFRSVAELKQAIHDYLDRRNADPMPFIWTKTADLILEKERRALDKLEVIKNGNKASESEH